MDTSSKDDIDNDNDNDGRNKSGGNNNKYDKIDNDNEEQWVCKLENLVYLGRSPGAHNLF